MKFLISLLLLNVCPGGFFAPAGFHAGYNPVEFNWLLGDWYRTNEKAGRNTIESWKKISASEYHGLSYTLSGRDTLFKEIVVLHLSGSDWFYDVQAEPNTAVTSFRLTRIEDGRFTCVNEENDFPKRIEYTRKGADLQAVISGGGPRILFSYKRLLRE